MFAQELIERWGQVVTENYAKVRRQFDASRSRLAGVCSRVCGVHLWSYESEGFDGFGAELVESGVSLIGAPVAIVVCCETVFGIEDLLAAFGGDEFECFDEVIDIAHALAVHGLDSAETFFEACGYVLSD